MQLGPREDWATARYSWELKDTIERGRLLSSNSLANQACRVKRSGRPKQYQKYPNIPTLLDDAGGQSN